MHYHAEVWIKDANHVMEDVNAAMLPHKEFFNEDTSGGFWDWYQIGGRWCGEHDPLYDPSKDPNNQRPCTYCGTTGKRTWPDGVKVCNVCGGTGIETLWPTEWEPVEKDIIPVSEVTDNYVCYTLILPNDVVLHKETWVNHTWEDTWDGNVKNALREYSIKDGFLVTVDYHN
jgi:hypothetical protein